MIPRTPIALEGVFDDPESIHALIARHSPYVPVQSFGSVMANAVEQAVITGEPIGDEMVRGAVAGGPRSLHVAPIFRRYFAIDGAELVEGAGAILAHHPLVEAARRLFGGTIVRPADIYVQPVCPQPHEAGRPHIDTPVFRGFARRETPVWLALVMRLSGLFERWRLRVATAVIWFYEGEGGHFLYWADGPDQPPLRTRPPYSNRAVVGENDSMYHSGEPIGPAPHLAGLSLQSRLVAEGEGRSWRVVDGERTLGRYARHELRFAISWSAIVFADAGEARSLDRHEDDITIEIVVERFLADLAARGIAARAPQDPWHDVDWVALLARNYVRVPKSVTPAEGLV